MAAVPASPITVIGAGLAGCECAHVLARLGHTVRLIDQKPLKRSAAHQSDGLAELVCSNSLRSDSPSTAIGLLHEELRKLGSVILGSADAARVPAGEALAVEREAFSKGVEEALARVGVKRESHEATAIAQDGITIVATGPLTSDALTKALEPLLGEKLYFYDAIAPIVSADSVDSNVSFRQSRWGKGDGDDYVNLPMDAAQYKAFVDALRAGGKVTPHDFEEARYFEGCLPIEVMAERGDEVLSHGPMKPVGLRDPRTGKQPHAVVQLRHENKAGTAYNLVGFQTRLTWPEQKRIFGMIPGLQNAEWLRLGQIHRNTFIDSPRLLSPDLSLKSAPQVFFAGQITGVEGYVESAACGHLTALCVHARLSGQTFVTPPAATALGALYRHVTGEAHPEGHDYQPSNVTFGLFPPLEGRVKRADKREAYSRRAREQLSGWLPNVPTAVPSPPPVASSLSTEVRP